LGIFAGEKMGGRPRPVREWGSPKNSKRSVKFRIEETVSSKDCDPLVEDCK